MTLAGESIYIIGSGGFGSEVLQWAIDSGYSVEGFVDDNARELGKKEVDVILPSEMRSGIRAVIAIGNPFKRRDVAKKLSKVDFATIVHPTCVIGSRVALSPGCIVCPNVVLTTNITIGAHAHLNLATTVGHDCVIGDYFTTAPKVAISGNSEIDDCVYFGTNSCIIEKKKVASGVVIGAAACVVKDICEPGTYVGAPA
jgi:sugar O-acyltransferase (sialic acid O-acetyltransferase NeuD family)